MHELSIAISIVEIAERHADQETAGKVEEVELDIGTLSGIEFEALEFALTVAVKETTLEHTRFRINRIEPLAECRSCSNLYAPGGIYSECPECGKADTRLIKGKELYIKSLLVEQIE